LLFVLVPWAVELHRKEDLEVAIRDQKIHVSLEAKAVVLGTDSGLFHRESVLESHLGKNDGSVLLTNGTQALERDLLVAIHQ
jgi:hypothetical protein